MIEDKMKRCVHCGTWLNAKPAPLCPECQKDPLVPEEIADERPQESEGTTPGS